MEESVWRQDSVEETAARRTLLRSEEETCHGCDGVMDVIDVTEVMDVMM